MTQTMPHVYKMSKHPKDKRYKKEKKKGQKVRCILNVLRMFSNMLVAPN